jgi:protein-tyrosine-phosphatase
MAGAVLAEHLPGVEVTTSGTHVIEGMPMSWRTRDAIAALGLPVPSHRSRQASPRELDSADLVIALARDHVEWMRRVHPTAASRTGTLRRLDRLLAHDDRPLADRVAELDLAVVRLEPWEDVIDPAGGDGRVFDDTAREIATLIHSLVPRLRPS